MAQTTGIDETRLSRLVTGRRQPQEFEVRLLGTLLTTALSTLTYRLWPEGRRSRRPGAVPASLTPR